VKIRVEQKRNYYTEIIKKIDKELIDLNELNQESQTGKQLHPERKILFFLTQQRLILK
jgi:hypothetical protein